MANDEELVINIKSDTSDFEKGVKKVTQKTEELAKATEKVNKELEHVDDAIKEVNKDTDKLSESTKKLTAEEEKSNYNVLRRAKSLEQYVRTLNEVNIHYGTTANTLNKVNDRYNKLAESIKNVSNESKYLLKIQQELNGTNIQDVGGINQQRKSYGRGLANRASLQGFLNESMGNLPAQVKRRLNRRYRGELGDSLGIKAEGYSYDKLQSYLYQKEHGAMLAENYQTWAKMFDQLEKDTSPKHVPTNIREKKYGNLFAQIESNRLESLRSRYGGKYHDRQQRMYEELFAEDPIISRLRGRYAKPISERYDNTHVPNLIKQRMYEQLFGNVTKQEVLMNLRERYAKPISERYDNTHVPSNIGSMSHDDRQKMYEQLFSAKNMNASYGKWKMLKTNVKAYGVEKMGGIKDFVGGLENLLPTYKQIISWSYKLAKVLITQVVPALAKAGLKMSQMTASGVGKFFKGMGTAVVGNVKAFNKLKSVLTGSQLHLGKLAKMFKNVILYRVFRTIIHSISTAFAEGTKNVYNWSALMKGTVYQSINKIASSLLYLKNGIGAVVAPLANYFAPVIDSVIDRVVELINQLNQLISKLTGASTWTKAIKTQTEWKDALDDSAKSAKQLTIGIDELNVVSDNNNNNATDYSGMFTEEVLPHEFNWIDSIKQLFSEGKFNELGSVVGTAFNSFVNKLSPKLQAIGEKIADNINKGVQIGLGFLSTADFENVGTTLANAFNKVVNKLEWKNLGVVLGKGWMVSFDIMRGFINSFGWEELGASVQKSVNALFDNIRARDVGDTISGLWNGIMKSFLAFVTKDEGLNWTRIGEKVAGFLNGLFVDFNWSDLSKSIYTSFNGLLETAETACNKFEWANFASELSGFINDTFENIQWGKLGGTLSRNAQKLFVTIRNFIADINWSSLGNKIGEMLNNVKWYDCFMAFWDITSTFCSGMADAILAIVDTANVANMFYQITTALIDTMFPSEKQLSESAKGSVGKLISAISSLLKQGIDGIWYAVKMALKNKLKAEGWDWLGDYMFPDWLQAEYEARLGITNSTETASERYQRINASVPESTTSKESVMVEVSLESWDRHRYATGGFPDEGQLFVAREAGAEMVGSIGNRTAVANNDQIVEAISIGVYDAVTSAMAGQKNGNTSVNVYLDGKQITSAVESRQRNRGATIYSGGLLVEG